MTNDIHNDEFYTKYLETWNNRSSIRTRPEKEFDVNVEGLFFPINKQPLMINETIDKLTDHAKQNILVQSLFRYLNIIITLELDLVNSVCNKIINNSTVVKYSNLQQQCAYTVFIDELYHVYIAKNIVNNLETKFTQDFDKYNADSIEAINVIKQKLDHKYHDIFEIIAICIFETTLIGELMEFFNTENIHAGVRCYINDHMNDEAKHATFFANILTYTWQNLTEDYKNAIGLILPEFLLSYLDAKVDAEFNKALIQRFFNKDECETIISSIYRGFKISPQMSMVKNILKVLRNANILHQKCVADSFNKMNWQI